MAVKTSNREVILVAAWRMFTQRGFHATSIRDIALEVGLPKGSVYNYFESKERILEAGIARAARLIETELRQKVLTGTLSPSQIVHRVFDYSLEVTDAVKFSSIDALSGLLSDLAGATPELAKHLLPVLSAWRAVVAQKIWAYATVARVPELIEQADPLAGLIQTTLQGALAHRRALHSPDLLLEQKHILGVMVDSYVNALAAGDVAQET